MNIEQCQMSAGHQDTYSHIRRLNIPQETADQSYWLWTYIALEKYFSEFLTNSLDTVFLVCYDAIMNFCSNGYRYTYNQVSHPSTWAIALLTLKFISPPPPC
jgi:hypothetical protein